MNQKLVSGFIITTFVSLYLVVSVISTIHVIDFFRLSNPDWLAISLAIAFEIGAAASLASLIALDKMNKGLIWTLFILLTLMQMMGNTFYAFTHLKDYQGWVELFGLVDEEPLYQKRVLSIISGAILPVVALGFIKSLVDYIRPNEDLVEKLAEVPTPTPKAPEPTPVSPEPAAVTAPAPEPVAEVDPVDPTDPVIQNEIEASSDSQEPESKKNS